MKFVWRGLCLASLLSFNVQAGLESFGQIKRGLFESSNLVKLLGLYGAYNPNNIGWADAAREHLVSEDISDQNSQLALLNAVVKIAKIDVARQSGEWESFFSEIGGSYKEKNAIDLAAGCLSVWGNQEQMVVFYNYIMESNKANDELVEWSALRSSVEAILQQQEEEMLVQIAAAADACIEQEAEESDINSVVGEQEAEESDISSVVDEQVVEESIIGAVIDEQEDEDGQEFEVEIDLECDEQEIDLEDFQDVITVDNQDLEEINEEIDLLDDLIEEAAE